MLDKYRFRPSSGESAREIVLAIFCPLTHRVPTLVRKHLSTLLGYHGEVMTRERYAMRYRMFQRNLRFRSRALSGTLV